MSTNIKKWVKYKGGYTVGKTGSENGIILEDEEFDGGCRITLEACKKYHAITCGVYGAMVHTVFCDPEDASTIYDNMKKDLDAFMSSDTTEDEELEFYEEFTSKY